MFLTRKVRLVRPLSLSLLALLGCGPAAPAPLAPEEISSTPTPIFELLIADREGDQLLRFDGAGHFLGRLGGVRSPTAVAQGADGALFVADFEGGQITRHPSDGSSPGVLFGDSVLLEEPVRLLRRGSTLYALGNDTMNVVAIDSRTGRALHSFGVPTMRFPHDLALGPGQRAFVAMEPNTTGGVIQVWDTSRGELVGNFAPPGEVLIASGITVGPDGKIYVSDWFGDRVLRYDPQTLALRDVFIPPGRLVRPGALEHGPDGRLYVLASGEILRFDGQTGVFIDVLVGAGQAGMVGPRGFGFALLPVPAPAAPPSDERPASTSPPFHPGVTRP